MSCSHSIGYPLGTWQRVLLGMWSLFLVTGFMMARHLDPSPQGFGTHQQLGFPPCTFQVLFGIACPSCGGTTSFAHFVRGHVFESFRVNPAAFVLAVTCLGMIPWSWYSVWRRRLWYVERPAETLLIFLIVLCAIALAQWMWRLSLP